MRSRMINFRRLFFVFMLLVSFTGCDSINLYFASKKATLNTSEKTLYVPTGYDLEQVAELFLKEGLIEEKNDFLAIGTYKKLEASRIAGGKYIIAPQTNLKEVLNGITLNSLGNGNKEVEVDVTIANCRDVYQLAGKVAIQLELDSTDLVNFILSDSTLGKYGFVDATIGALFLPNTYRFFWDTNEEDFVERMAKEFRGFWNEERKVKLNAAGFSSPSEAVTLASVVYKEQDKYPEEWPTIAGLYINRLKNGWKLQSDPTFRFCWGDQLKGVKRLTFEHRKIDCPYNTYLYAGLPPGPIFIPPSSVVEAVLNFEQNSYFYMCAKPDGNGLHNFARSLSEHNRNARIYQAWLTKQNIR